MYEINYYSTTNKPVRYVEYLDPVNLAGARVVRNYNVKLGPSLTWYHKNGLVAREFWLFNNKGLHRLDGPAIINYDEDGNIVRMEFWVDSCPVGPKHSKLNLQEFYEKNPGALSILMQE